MEAIATKDLDTLLAGLHDDVVDDFVALGKLEGKDEIRAFYSELFTAVPDLQLTIDRIIDGGGSVAVGQWSYIGTFSGGRFQGLEPTDRRVELRGVDVMEFEDGRLRRNTIYYDGLGFARQIGMLPTKDSGVDRVMTSGFNAVTKAKRGIGTTIQRLTERSPQDA